jgi:hypothetical protein
MSLVPVPLRPVCRGYVTIHSTDPFQQLKVYTKAFKSHKDPVIVTYSCKLAMKLEKTKAFQKAGISLDRTPLDGCTHLENGTDKYFDCVSRILKHSVNHPLGTNKMGPSSPLTAALEFDRAQLYLMKNSRGMPPNAFKLRGHMLPSFENIMNRLSTSSLLSLALYDKKCEGLHKALRDALALIT